MRKEHLTCLAKGLLINIQVMEKNREHHHGYAIEDTTLVSSECITGTGHLALFVTDMLVVGRLHGYARIGEGLIFSICVRIADHLVMEGLSAMVDPLDLGEKEVA